MKNPKTLWFLVKLIPVVAFLLALIIGALVNEFIKVLLIATISFVIYWILALLTSYKSVPTMERWITELYGNFERELKAGPNFILPFGIETIKSKVFMGQQMMELYLNKDVQNGYGAGDVEFSDCSGMAVKAFFYFKINDAYKATYKIFDLFDAVEEKVDSILRINFMFYTLDQAMNLQGKFNLESIACYVNLISEPIPVPADLHAKYLLSPFYLEFAEFGIEAKSFVISDFNMSDDIKKQRERKLIVSADVEVAKSNLIKARIEKKTLIVGAEAKKEAKVLEGQGAASKISAVSKAVGLRPEQAAKYLTEELKWSAIAESKSTDKVILIEGNGGNASNGAKFGAGYGAVKK